RCPSHGRFSFRRARYSTRSRGRPAMSRSREYVGLRLGTVHAFPAAERKVGPACRSLIASFSNSPSFLPIGMRRRFPVFRAVLCSRRTIAFAVWSMPEQLGDPRELRSTWCALLISNSVDYGKLGVIRPHRRTSAGKLIQLSAQPVTTNRGDR